MFISTLIQHFDSFRILRNQYHKSGFKGVDYSPKKHEKKPGDNPLPSSKQLLTDRVLILFSHSLKLQYNMYIHVLVLRLYLYKVPAHNNQTKRIWLMLVHLSYKMLNGISFFR